MQTLREIRELLASAGLAPRKRLGQCFLIDQNLMGKLVDLAAPSRSQTILEVGAGTGSLTEELLERAGKVVAVEIDRGLAGLLRQRLGSADRLALIEGDVLHGKSRIRQEVLEALGESAVVVSNLPYNVACPLVADCLMSSWHAASGSANACRFGRLTVTVQCEVAERLVARPGRSAYGPLSVLCGLLARSTPGPIVPAEAFWPRPKIASRILRLDFDEPAARALADAETLRATVAVLFQQRRKQIGSVLRRRPGREPAAIGAALAVAGIDPKRRAEDVAPEQFRLLANALAARRRD